MKQPDALATDRMQLIMKVQAGITTAQEAASQLGISRTAYYKWEEKALMAMYSAVTNGEPGRPPNCTNPEIEEKDKQIAQLRRQVLFLEQDREIRKLLFGDINPGVEEKTKAVRNKKKGSRKKKKKRVTGKGKKRR